MVCKSDSKWSKCHTLGINMHLPVYLWAESVGVQIINTVLIQDPTCLWKGALLQPLSAVIHVGSA